MVMCVVAVAAMGYAQTGTMSAEQVKTMGDQMKGGKVTADQMQMMGEHMQMMADRMKDGQMTPDQMKKMNDHMTMMKEHMKGGMKGKM